ncbi:MAG: O-antigen ligase family protein [Elusimicrobia bacterium]|nr:O-antigen ligase family protein [Elusimicrobiota bacterium]
MKKYTLDELIFFGLGLFACSVIFSVTAVEAALFLVLALLLLRKYREGSLTEIRPALTGHALFVPWALYLGVCLLTALTAYYPAKGLGQVNSDLIKYVCLATLLLAVKKEHLPRLSAVYTAAAAVSALFGILEVARSVLAGDAVLARAGVFMNAVRYGEAMTIAFLLALSRLLLPAKESFRRERLFYALAAVAVFSALILTQTRGAYLGAATGVLAIFFFAAPARRKLAVYAGVMLAAAVVLAAAAPAVRDRVAAMLTVRRGDFSGNSASTGINVRIELWKVGYKMFRAHPVVGVGPDNIRKVFKEFHPEPFPEEGVYGTLNNLYVHQAAERGSLGLAALLLLFGALFLFALKRFRAALSPYALWALCALPAFYAVNLTEISFQHVHTSFAIFLALAFAAAADKEEI